MRAARISYKGHLIGEIHSDGQTAFCNCYNKAITYRKMPQSMWADGRFDRVTWLGVFNGVDGLGLHEDEVVGICPDNGVGLVIEVTIDAKDVSPVYVICYYDGSMMTQYVNVGDVNRLRVRIEDVSQEV